MKTEWISVKDRLPERGIKVLVCDNNYINIASRPTNLELRILSEIYEKEFPEHVFDSPSFFAPSSDTTHWMPLPEPPKQ